MKKIKYIIAEDEDIHINQLQKVIQKTPYAGELYMGDLLECVAVCKDGLSAKKALREFRDVQLLFLDNRMPEMTGKSLLDVLNDYPNPPVVLVISQHPEDAIDLINFNKSVKCAMRKPVTLERFKAAMEMILDSIWGKKKTFLKICYSVEAKMASCQLDVEELAYVESNKNVITFHYANPLLRKYEQLVSNGHYHTLDKLSEVLPQKDFYRFRNSHIVNRHHIQGITETNLHMRNDVLIGFTNPKKSPYSKTLFLEWYQHSILK